MTVAQWVKEKECFIDLGELLKLQETVKLFHSLVYVPAQIGWLDKQTRSVFEPQGPSFYEDISPQNIVCESIEDEKFPRYRLIDYGYSNQFNSVAWTPGWGSPETIAYCKNKKYQHLSSIEFNQKYGQKKIHGLLDY